MPRFLLLVRELGKAPRAVPVTQTLVVGRSRRADVVIDDEEVSREQCRVGLQGALVVLEGLGKTNLTVVDGTPVDAGQRVTLTVGATIKVGRTTLQLQAGDTTENAPVHPGALDATMVAPGPAPTPAPPASELERTGGFAGPGGAGATLPPGPGRPGGAAAAPPTPPRRPADDVVPEMTMQPGAYRPGQAPATPPKTEAGAVPEMTMQPGVYRPGQPPAPRGDAAPEMTMQPGAYRPGQGSTPPANPGPAAAPPVKQPARPAAPPTTDQDRSRSTPPPPPPRPSPAAGDTPARPKTVMVSAEAMKGGLVTPTPTLSAELEGRMHQAMPRLYVKGDTLRRRLRLMKARTRIGRAETADVLLPNESVSEQHAEIDFDGGRWLLRDCGSTNGTLVGTEVVRSTEVPIGRHTLLGFGNLRGLFLCNEPGQAAAELRFEERALRQLVASGKVPKDVARQVLAVARRDPSQSIAEILLGDTSLEPADWAVAVTAARQRRSLLDRLLALFGRKPAAAAR